MGKAEKIVVLGMLFSIVLILVVSLDTGGSGGEGTRVVMAAAGAAQGEAAGAAEGTAEPQPPGPDLLRQTGLQPQTGLLDQTGSPLAVDRGGPGGANPHGILPLSAASLLTSEIRLQPIYEVPAVVPEDWALTTLAGLADHRYDPSLKVYVVRAGDTFEDLARRYYGDPHFAELLHRNNEGLRELQDGQQILIPVMDDGLGRASTYLVQEGESLWKIAEKVYGQGHRWGEIWEANRDVLPSPDDITAGLELRIP